MDLLGPYLNSYEKYWGDKGIHNILKTSTSFLSTYHNLILQPSFQVHIITEFGPTGRFQRRPNSMPKKLDRGMPGLLKILTGENIL